MYFLLCWPGSCVASNNGWRAKLKVIKKKVRAQQKCLPKWVWNPFFELCKSYKHKILCTINFLKNEAIKNIFISQNGGPPLTHSPVDILWNWKPWIFSEDYKRGVCLDDLDVGLDWYTLFNVCSENSLINTQFNNLCHVNMMHFTVSNGNSIINTQFMYVMWCRNWHTCVSLKCIIPWREIDISQR